MVTVWLSGDHFIHVVRRNVDMNIVLFNNKIYGLTKGQYSPTSDRGFVSKSSPFGTVEEPFVPAELTLGARGTFFARSIDVDLKNSTDILIESAKHKGTSVVEVLVNCVIFKMAPQNIAVEYRQNVPFSCVMAKNAVRERQR